MLHIKFALAALVLVLVFAHLAQSQTVNNTQVTMSCNDGHSVIFDVDQITLSSLLADVQSINASGTGTSCTLTMAAIDPSSQTTNWTVYDYNPSNQAIAPRNSPNSMPATTTGNTTTFQFTPGIYTALLTTKDPSLTGRSLHENTDRYDQRQRRRRKLHDSAQRRRLRVQRPCCREVLLRVPVRVRAKHGYTSSGFLHPVLVVEPSGRAAGERNPNAGTDNCKHV